MATHKSINRARDDDDYTVHEASRYVCQEDHRGGFKVKGIIVQEKLMALSMYILSAVNSTEIDAI